MGTRGRGVIKFWSWNRRDAKILPRYFRKIQRRAARFTLNNYRRTSSVGAMMQQLSWQTLAERRRASRLAMLYKMNNNLVAVDITKYLSSKNHTCPTRTENSQAFCIPHSERDYHKSSYFPKTARDWNQLPEDLVQSTIYWSVQRRSFENLGIFLHASISTSSALTFNAEVCTTLEEEEGNHIVMTPSPFQNKWWPHKLIWYSLAAFYLWWCGPEDENN